MARDSKRRKRSGGRAGSAERRGSAAIEQMPWAPPINTDRPHEPLDEAGVQAIHDGAMRILEEIGIEFLNEEAIEILRGSGGCTINGENVRMGRDFVMEMVAKAPSKWTITPRNPARQITIGGKHLNFGNVSSPPSYWDMEIGKKVTGTREMCQNLLKLSQYFNCIHFVGGYPVEPQDVHASIRHLDVLYDKLTLTDKVAHAYCLGKERVEDVMEMVRIAGGHTDAEFESGPKMYTNINSTSPLKHDYPMLDGWMRLARRNQGLVVTPFTLAGAMAPVTMSGAVAQSLAEGLVAVVLAQIIRPRRVLCHRHVHLECGHEIRGTGLWHTGIHARHPDDRATGAVLRSADARQRGLCRQRARRSGDVGDLEQPVVSGAGGGAYGLSRGWLAGGWTDRKPRKIRDGLRNPAANSTLYGPDAYRDRPR